VQDHRGLARNHTLRRVEHGAAQAQLLAHALAQQLCGGHAPAGLRVGAWLLGVAVRQAVQHGGAVQRGAGLYLSQHQRGQRCHTRGGSGNNRAGAKIIDGGADLGFER